MSVVTKRILYADDDKDSCEVMTILLGRFGYEVISAHRPEDALAKVKSDSFDLCLLDNWFEDGSGVELCRQILSLRPEVPIIFYSGAVYESDKQAAFAAGARAYLVKPTGLEVIGQTIARLLNGDGAARRDSNPLLDEIKQVGQLCADGTRARIERSRELMRTSRDRIARSGLKMEGADSNGRGHQ